MVKQAGAEMCQAQFDRGAGALPFTKEIEVVFHFQKIRLSSNLGYNIFLQSYLVFTHWKMLWIYFHGWVGVSCNHLYGLPQTNYIGLSENKANSASA